MTHTLYARHVAVRYVIIILFAKNVIHGLRIFHKMYMRHQRTLYLKRVSKGNAKSKAKSPPVVDDDASTASIESHVSPPMVILPLDPHLVDAEMNLAELGNIQTVDSVVEIQYQPKSPPPPHPTPPPRRRSF